jgi:hypothetical protein
MFGGFLNSLRSRGIGVMVWGWDKRSEEDGGGRGGVNTIQGFERVLRAGASGVCTDAPSLLREFVVVSKEYSYKTGL